ncbi:hypothetical protein D3C84_1038760 [compost metagenome]
MQGLARDDLQIQFAGFRGGGVGFQFGDLVLAVTDAHMAAGDELEVVVDQLRQSFP